MAIKEKEVDLGHTADSWTKCLPTQCLERFRSAIDLVEHGGGTDEDLCEPTVGVMVYMAGVAVVFQVVATLGIQAMHRIRIAKKTRR